MQLSPRDYQEFLLAALRAYEDEPWRMGQSYFNVLRERHPEIAEHYRGSMVDPFYNDSLIPEFLWDLHLKFVED